MKILNSLLLFMLVTVVSIAQHEEPNPCGTPPFKDPWLAEFQLKLPDMLQKRTDSLIYVPLTIHNVGKDDGTGFFRVSSILQAFCTLNNDFSGTNIQFYIKDTIINHSRTEWYDHPTVVDGAFMMFEANVENTLNIYFVANPAGNCGYNLPYAGIAMNTGCSAPGDHTWAHEIGHAFSLPHPFLGWEGDVYDYTNPTPERVTYDYTYFKDSLILDTTIIDTAWVEFVERKNCLFAGDGFCDTNPDYISRRWNCNQTTGESNDLQKDPDEVDFRSDGTLFMSYATDACSNRFSPDQVAAMHANINDRKPYLIDGKIPEENVSTDPAVLVLPADGGTAATDNALFSWEPLKNATGYIFQISRFRDFRFIQEELITSNTEAEVSGLRDGIRYYWRIRGFNAYHTCSEFSDPNSFTASRMVSVRPSNKLNILQIYPNPLPASEDLIIQFNNNYAAGDVTVTLYSALGQILYQQVHYSENGKNSVVLPFSGLNFKGNCYVSLANELGISTFKLVTE